MLCEPPGCSNIAFIKDPDGYWIEILSPDNSPQFVNWPGNQQ
jgi:hypothetical protein